MTERQQSIVEAFGLVLIALGMAWGFGMPWGLIPIGVLCVAYANAGRVKHDVTSQHPSTQ